MSKTINLSSLRNFGVIAHIDAGKTTVSERILYYTGKEHRIGEVHEGTAKMDWMEEEQERGITITAAATTTSWKGYTLNLIDTPGHVDFTAEVERSLRVLDGAVIVLCGVAGVEAQSETVWRQATRYKVPRVVFVNKMDRMGADFEKVLLSAKNRLKAVVVPIQYPVGSEDNFQGIIDLVRMKYYTYQGDKGERIEENAIPDEHMDTAKHWRDNLLDHAANESDEMMELVLEGKDIPTELLVSAIRKATIKQSFFPVLCGSALKNKGVQLLLDAINDYLPCPLDIPTVSAQDEEGNKMEWNCAPDEELCALAFKIFYDKHGELIFLRVYSGTITEGEQVYIPRTGKMERISRLVRLHANERQNIKEAGCGDIVATIGLKTVFTGDTLCSKKKPVVLESMKFPETVISMVVEPKTNADREKMALALANLSREDPTFRRHVDEETGQMIISGMGELHLEVIKNRMLREFRIDANVGTPKVAYKQTVNRTVEATGTLIRQSGGRGQYGVVRVRMEPSEVMDNEVVNELNGEMVPKQFWRAAENGVKGALKASKEGYPVVKVKVTMIDGKYHAVDSSEVAFQAAASIAVEEALRVAGAILLEPIMRLEVTSPEEFVGSIIHDLNSRRAMVESMEATDDFRMIHAKVPLAEMFGYATVVRSLSQGRASYSMEPCEYMPVPRNVLEKLKENQK